MRTALALGFLSLTIFVGLTVMNPPLPDRFFTEADEGRRQSILNPDGLRLAPTTLGPVVLFRRPFEGMLARALFLLNLPPAVVTIATQLHLSSGTLPSRTISDVAGGTFISALTLWWLGIALVVRRIRRRAA